ncbi:MAG: hypothetical protein AAFQ98_00825 [Bacteroidota bacterium]
MKRFISPIQLLMVVLLLANLVVFCSNSGEQESPTQVPACIPFNPDSVNYVSLDEFKRDVARFQKEIGSGETRDLQQVSNRREAADVDRAFEGYEDKLASRQVTFTLHRLKNYIHEVEQAAMASGINLNRLAITWSFAIYDHTDSHNEERDHRSLQTLYGLPSVVGGNGAKLYVGIDNKLEPLRNAALNQEVQASFIQQIALTSIRDTEKENAVSLIIGPEDAAFNRGYLCPPSCGDDQDDLFGELENLNSSYTEE